MTENEYGPSIEVLEALWGDPDGVLFRLRQGVFDPTDAATISTALGRIDQPEEDELLPRRLVSLLWYLPSFMEWQLGRVEERNGDVDGLRRLIDQTRSRVEEVLGVP